MPVIVILPGIAAFILYQNGYFGTEMLQDDTVKHDRVSIKNGCGTRDSCSEFRALFLSILIIVI